MCIHHTGSCKFVLLCDASGELWSLNKQPWQTSAHRHLCGCVTVLQGCLIICSTSLVTVFWLYCMNNHNYSLSQQWFPPTKICFLNITKSRQSPKLKLLQFHKKPSTGLNDFSFILDNMQGRAFVRQTQRWDLELGGDGVPLSIISLMSRVNSDLQVFIFFLREDSWMKWRSACRGSDSSLFGTESVHWLRGHV